MPPVFTLSEEKAGHLRTSSVLLPLNLRIDENPKRFFVLAHPATPARSNCADRAVFAKNAIWGFNFFVQ
jgi:hypothetical protein